LMLWGMSWGFILLYDHIRKFSISSHFVAFLSEWSEFWQKYDFLISPSINAPPTFFSYNFIMCFVSFPFGLLAGQISCEQTSHFIRNFSIFLFYRFQRLIHLIYLFFSLRFFCFCFGLPAMTRTLSIVGKTAPKHERARPSPSSSNGWFYRISSLFDRTSNSDGSATMTQNHDRFIWSNHTFSVLNGSILI
jgi:hypothetical protein